MEGDENKTEPFYFNAENPDKKYGLKIKYGSGSSKGSGGVFNFKKSYIGFSGKAL
jgi:hypothetical protein